MFIGLHYSYFAASFSAWTRLPAPLFILLLLAISVLWCIHIHHYCILQLLQVSIYSEHRELWLLGPIKTQVLYNTSVLDSMKSGWSFCFPSPCESGWINCLSVTAKTQYPLEWKWKKTESWNSGWDSSCFVKLLQDISVKSSQWPPARNHCCELGS